MKRYLFTSWSCTTHEFYEAPQPWGPWSHIAPSATVGSTASQPSTTDFGPWLGTYNRGQYGTTIPSKFISADGHSMWLQSNVCFTASQGGACASNSYTFSLRQLSLEQAAGGSASNNGSNQNLALVSGTSAISKSSHYGTLCGANCAAQLSSGNLASEDDADNEEKTTDWWGYTWSQPYNMNKVTYKTGTMFTDGGWFASSLRVQVRQNGQWVETGSTVSPAYPYSNAAASQTTYTFTFSGIAGDGVRIIGTPGGASHFTSINQLAVTYGSATSGLNLVQDPGFEQQSGSSVSSPWTVEGTDNHGIDIDLGFAHTGLNDAWIRDSTNNWNAVSQPISVLANTGYTFTASIQNNFPNNIAYCGVRDANNNVVQETQTQAAPQYVTQSVAFNSGTNTTMRVFCGFWGNNSDQWIRIDDVSVH